MSDHSKLGLGQIITTDQKRDAIHVAVAPVVAGEPIEPGDHLTLLANGEAVTSNGVDPTIGVADPFLKQGIKTGERFWLFLYPGTITSLRHEWAHPAFGAEEKVVVDKAASEKWVRAYVAENCPYYDNPEIRRMYPGDSLRDGYTEFMERVRRGEIYYYGSDLHGAYELEDAEELFGHLAILLGRPVGQDDFTYSCSC